MVNGGLTAAAQPAVNCHRDTKCAGNSGAGVQRKTFRIEAMLTRARSPLAKPIAAQPNADTARLERELAAIYDAIEKSRQDIAALTGDTERLSRAGQELNAAVGGMEKATVQILKATEGAEEGARALASTARDDYTRGLAQDIQDHVSRIYEACNFQDLAGQRIGKALATLAAVEQRVAALAGHWSEIQHVRRSSKPEDKISLINGPRLDGDSGHASQRDIDKMFA